MAPITCFLQLMNTVLTPLVIMQQRCWALAINSTSPSFHHMRIFLGHSLKQILWKFEVGNIYPVLLILISIYHYQQFGIGWVLAAWWQSRRADIGVWHRPEVILLIILTLDWNLYRPNIGRWSIANILPMKRQTGIWPSPAQNKSNIWWMSPRHRDEVSVCIVAMVGQGFMSLLH